MMIPLMASGAATAAPIGREGNRVRAHAQQNSRVYLDAER